MGATSWLYHRRVGSLGIWGGRRGRIEPLILIGTQEIAEKLLNRSVCDAGALVSRAGGRCCQHEQVIKYKSTLGAQNRKMAVKTAGKRRRRSTNTVIHRLVISESHLLQVTRLR